MLELTAFQKLIVWVPPVLLAITLHEAAHGWLASRLGDPTARMLGRVSANPVKHIDPVGTVLVPGVLLLLGGFLFGWAKPVPITARNFDRPRRDMALVGAAGPLSNLLMAFLWAMVIRGAGLFADNFSQAGRVLLLMGIAGIFINVSLTVLNLLPLPPLDGGRILSGILPGRYASVLDRLEPYGLLILVGLIVTGFLSRILGPPLFFLLHALLAASGLQLATGFMILQHLLPGG
jgi:Zn-dependent protease